MELNITENFKRVKSHESPTIAMVGDIHGEFSKLNSFMGKHKNLDILIQAGDNAYYWSGISGYQEIKPNKIKVYLVPGNHDHWDLIEERVGRHGKIPVEIEPNIFYCPIGSTLDINGTVIMFIGGADSIDKQYRTPKLSWWAQEVLTDEDYDYIVSSVEKVDIIVSHTCPNYFDVKEQLYYDKGYDPTRYILDKIHDKYKPAYWFFGHWHRFIRNRYENTEWCALDMVGSKNWSRFCSIINKKAD